MSEETVDLVALMNMRARTYGLLANLFREEVDADSLRELQAMRFPTATGNAKVDEGYHLLYDYLKTAWDDSATWSSPSFHAPRFKPFSRSVCSTSARASCIIRRRSEVYTLSYG